MAQGYDEVRIRWYMRREPFRSLYIVYWLVCLIARWPLWLVQALFSRPRPGYSLYATLSIRSIKALTPLLSRTGLLLNRDLRIEPKASSLKLSRFVWAKGIASERIGGFVEEMARRKPSVEVDRVPCFMFAKDLSTLPRAQSPHEPLVIYCHGGAYVLGSAEEGNATNRKIPLDLLQYSTKATKVLSVDYRSAVPFPSALIDALSAYNHAVSELGYTPERIIMVGDSAGGNLVQALLRALRDSKILPMPAGAVLISPWTDMTLPRLEKNRDSDLLDREMGPYSVARFFKGVKEAQRSSYCSPGAKGIDFSEDEFEGFPPLLFVAGDAEILIDEITLAHDRFKRVGNNSTLIVKQDACHDFVLFSFMPQATETMKEVSQWIDEHL